MPKPDPAASRGAKRATGGSRPQPRPRPAAEPSDLPVQPDKLPVSEFLYNRAGAASPFGDDVTFPLPSGHLSYRHQ